LQFTMQLQYNSRKKSWISIDTIFLKYNVRLLET